MPVATAISRTFNQLTLYPKSLFSFTRTLTQSLDLTRKFFLTQARAHAEAPRNFVIKRSEGYCAFHKHANSEVQKPTDHCVFRCRKST